MFDYLNNAAFVETRAGIRRFVAEELAPMERELGLGSEDIWPRDVLRRVWRRSAELGFYSACLRGAGRQGIFDYRAMFPEGGPRCIWRGTRASCAR